MTKQEKCEIAFEKQLVIDRQKRIEVLAALKAIRLKMKNWGWFENEQN